MQTQIRLLPEEQSDQGLYYSPFHFDTLNKIPYGFACEKMRKQLDCEEAFPEVTAKSTGKLDSDYTAM